MPAYESASFQPPAPVAEVTIRSPTTGDSVNDVKMIIDTGADVSLMPRPAIEQILDDTDANQQYELEGFDGTRSLASVFHLELYFLGRVFRGQFLLIDQEYGILGRNVLNAISLTLDGPNLQWDQRQ